MTRLQRSTGPIAIVCGLLLLLTIAQRGRQPPPAVAPAGAAAPGHAETIRMQNQLRETEAKLSAAHDDLTEALTKLNQNKREAEQAANQPGKRPAVAENEAFVAAQIKRLEEQLAETRAESDKAKRELAEIRNNAFAEDDRQAAAAKPAAAPDGLGRGAILDQQVRQDPRRFRDPNLPGAKPNAAAIAAAGAPSAGGQGGGFLMAGSTAAGDMMRGQAELARGVGQFNLDTSRAMINLQTARSMGIENRMQWTETFFDMRRVNRTNRALEAGPRPTMEQVVRFARMQAPRRLTPLEVDPLTGEIAWPLVLTDERYDDDREFLDAEFRERAARTGSLDYAHFEKVNTHVDDLKIKLKANVAKYPPARYGEARTFLDSLQREFQMPVTQ
jgi:hypothetical protein